MQHPLSLDVNVANRFISSLSKSLQALCHGCMDFENGIEIVGFINVNIDSGCKVDYVLNEKVQKSTDNSMTFVSNSFLAKKDQPKQTKDGSCSPVPEFNTFESSQHRGSYQHTQQRPANTYTSEALNPRGTQKRSWNGMERQWRGSPRKQFRGGQACVNEEQSYGNSYTSVASAPSPSQSFPTSQKHGEVKDSNSGDCNVKQEAVESEFLCDRTKDTDTTNELVNIKSDPDANPETNSVCGQPGNENFLHKSSEVSEEQDPKAPCDIPVSVTADNQYESSESIDNGQSYISAAGPSNQNQSNSEPAYNQPEYEDYGEASADVIEIDDDDEDIKAMFGHSNNTGRRSNYLNHSQDLTSSSLWQQQNPSLDMSTQMLEAKANTTGFTMLKQCPFCPHTTPSVFLKQHIMTFHGGEMPYACNLCGRGFLSQSGLYHHKVTHEGRRFACPICDNKFNQKAHLKTHLRKIHQLDKCEICNGTFDTGPKFDEHLSNCHL